jgi:exodeoxyribonuclease-5
LTEILRQALDNPITALATRIRTSKGAGLGLTRDDFRPASIREAATFDQVLVWTNKKRWALVRAIREIQGLPKDGPGAGDRIMCLTNNKDLAVFNGQQFEVLESTPGTLGPTLRVRTDEGSERAIPAFSDAFMGQEIQEQAKNSGAGRTGGRMLATYAQAITVHKSQGSEYERVYVTNEVDNMISMVRRQKGPAEAIAQGRQWLYTAVTRARGEVVITAPRSR